MDNIEHFLIAHRNKLQTDKNNLILPQNSISFDKQKHLPNDNDEDEKIVDEETKTFMDFLHRNEDDDAIEPLAIAPKTGSSAFTTNMCSMATTLPMLSPSSHTQQKNTTPLEGINSDNFQIYDNLNLGSGRKYNNNFADKTSKNLTNLNERQVAADNTKNVAGNSKYRVNKDDMEQWVSDTFYSYFPGFNNENKKRQDLLQNRQLEYQQNLLKHQMNAEAAKKKVSNKSNNEDTKLEQQNNIHPENINHKPTSTSTTSRSSDKTDLEIIVNNPDYEIKSPRPGSARYKHLQDLKHTSISTMVNNDGVTERNQRNAELEMAKKKNYQRELMAQIEEHRCSLAALKEKERRQDEVLTKRLEEQLKTMRLQEELEKEKMRVDRMRFDTEQNRLMREHLLNKLETDTKALEVSVRKTQSEISKITPAAKNKVYKYFSNSARHEFRRDSSNERPAFHAEIPSISPQIHQRHPYKKCFHDDINTNKNQTNVCPFCDAALKSYENYCLKCEKRIFDAYCAREETESLVCANCKKLYSICSTCNDDDDDDRNCCVHCQKHMNICSNCEKSLCSECVDAIGVEKDRHGLRQKTGSERSFEILEVNYPQRDDDDAAKDLNNNPQERDRLPYSMNIDGNSIFHQNYDRVKIYDEENNMEEIRYQTDQKLSRYLKNYGDLACKALRDRSTQTTPDTSSRRDIVMVEENNLSMPLLREMPRMTRKESNYQQAERKKKDSRIENLARRWEIPAVQKHTITTNSPKVLTQLGAIRKQLQSEQLKLDF